MRVIKYVTQMNFFIKFAIEKKMTPYERLLWLGIFWSANKLAQRTGELNLWPDGFFPIDMKDLCTLTGLSERAIRKCRDVLKELGLIDYLKGDGKRANPQYKLFYFKLKGCEIVPDGAPDHTPDHARNSAPDNAGNNVGITPSTSDKNSADTACDQAPEAFNHKDSSHPTDSFWGTDTGSSSAAAAGSEPLKEESSLQSIFGDAKFVNLDNHT